MERTSFFKVSLMVGLLASAGFSVPAGAAGFAVKVNGLLIEDEGIYDISDNAKGNIGFIAGGPEANAIGFVTQVLDAKGEGGTIFLTDYTGSVATTGSGKPTVSVRFKSEKFSKSVKEAVATVGATGRFTRSPFIENQFIEDASVVMRGWVSGGFDGISSFVNPKLIGTLSFDAKNVLAPAVFGGPYKTKGFKSANSISGRFDFSGKNGDMADMDLFDDQFEVAFVNVMTLKKAETVDADAMVPRPGKSDDDAGPSGGPDVSGSYFAFDIDGNGSITGSEKIPFIPHQWLDTTGFVQPASGSHSGVPDGTESSSIDVPWTLFGSTGMHSTVGDGLSVVEGATIGEEEINFSNWRVQWNGLEGNLGGGMQDCGTTDDGICVTPGGTDIGGMVDNGSGKATVTCDVLDCGNNSNFLLDYLATVPLDDASGFGGTSYVLHLEGFNVNNADLPESLVPIPGAVWLFGSGLLGLVGMAKRKKAL